MVDVRECFGWFQCLGVFLPESQIKMAYKTKICPKCKAEHNKRGEFCSRSCGNSRRQTPEQRQKIADANRARINDGSDESEIRKHNYISKRNYAEPEPVPPQIHTPLGNRQFIADGDLWEET